MHVLSLVQQQHRTQIADPLVRKSWIGRQLEAFELREMRRIAQHMDVEEFGDVATTPQRILFAECRSNVGRLFVDDGTLFGGRSGGSNLPDQITQSGGRGHAHCALGGGGGVDN